VIEEWFGRFIAKHMRRFPRADWPADETDAYWEMFQPWVNRFHEYRVSEFEAEAASLRMDSAGSPRNRGKHLGNLLELVHQARTHVPTPTAEHGLPVPTTFGDRKASYARENSQRDRWERLAAEERENIVETAKIENSGLWKSVKHIKSGEAFLLPWCYEEMDRRATLVTSQGMLKIFP